MSKGSLRHQGKLKFIMRQQTGRQRWMTSISNVRLFSSWENTSYTTFTPTRWGISIVMKNIFYLTSSPPAFLTRFVFSWVYLRYSSDGWQFWANLNLTLGKRTFRNHCILIMLKWYKLNRLTLQTHSLTTLLSWDSHEPTVSSLNGQNQLEAEFRDAAKRWQGFKLILFVNS